MKDGKQSMQLHNRKQIEYYSSKIKPRMVPKATPYIIRQIDELIKFANIEVTDTVLEVGCGMGRCTLPLAERGIHVEGLDLTQFLLNKLQKYNRGRYDILLYCADMVDHPPELNNRFDFVIGFFTLHHLHNIPACFKAMAQMVKPGGSIVFLEPNAFNPLYYIQILITPDMTWEGDGGVVHMRKSIIFNAMREAGLVNLQLACFGFFPPFISNSKWGSKLESVLEQMLLLRPFLPFQLFKGTRI